MKIDNRISNSSNEKSVRIRNFYNVSHIILLRIHKFSNIM